MNALSLTLFGILWLGIIYGLNCLIARQFKRINVKTALLYFVAVGAIGLFGEIFLDTIYNFFVGTPLWRYNILPIHNAYTSAYAPIVWGIYGFHLYLLHGTFEKWSITRTRYLALILCFEALIIEAALTISAKFLLGDFMYYYYPGDLWHVTSLQNIPFYFICGAIIVQSMRRFKKDRLFFALMCAFLILVIVFFTK